MGKVETALVGVVGGVMNTASCTLAPVVILNLFQDNEPRSHVILKQVQDDELWGEEVGSTPISGMTQLLPALPRLSLQTYTQNAVFL